jgi:hypothetical protein
MTIKELKEAISDLPDEMEVILQKDPTGNIWAPLRGIDPDAIYIKKQNWSGEVYSTNWSADDADMSEEEWEELKLKPKCLVLYPIN